MYSGFLKMYCEFIMQEITASTTEQLVHMAITMTYVIHNLKYWNCIATPLYMYSIIHNHINSIIDYF